MSTRNFSMALKEIQNVFSTNLGNHFIESTVALMFTWLHPQVDLPLHYLFSNGKENFASKTKTQMATP